MCLNPAAPIGQSPCWTHLPAKLLGTDEQGARNNKLELRQNPRGNTEASIEFTSVKGARMQRESVPQRLPGCMLTLRMDHISPGYHQRPLDHLFLILTSIVAFISRLLSKLIPVLRKFFFFNSKYMK